MIRRHFCIARCKASAQPTRSPTRWITAGADNCAIRAVGNPKICTRPSSLVSAEPIERKSLTGESRAQTRFDVDDKSFSDNVSQLLGYEHRRWSGSGTSHTIPSPDNSFFRQRLMSNNRPITCFTAHASTVAPASHDPPKTFSGEAYLLKT